MVVVRKVTVSEVMDAENYSALLKEYEAECAAKNAPPVKPHKETYQVMAISGRLQVFGAFLEDKLIGFVNVIVNIAPHYSKILGITESYFVGKAFRPTGAGDMLRRAAEGHAESLNAYGCVITAPTDSVLAEVLEKSDEYEETNRVFFKRFKSVQRAS